MIETIFLTHKNSFMSLAMKLFILVLVSAVPFLINLSDKIRDPKRFETDDERKKPHFMCALIGFTIIIVGCVFVYLGNSGYGTVGQTSYLRLWPWLIVFIPNLGMYIYYRKLEKKS